MERRELLKMIAVLTGVSMVGGDMFLTGCKTGATASATFTDADTALLNEVAETIIPATSSPGAKAAKVGNHMVTMVNDCYNSGDQTIFHEGLVKLDEACKKANGKSFMDCTPEQRTSFLTALDKEAKEYNKTKKKEDPNHYFTMMKQLTISGYFTSKEGATQALRYVAVPGKFDGAYPYKKGDKAWATS